MRKYLLAFLLAAAYSTAQAADHGLYFGAGVSRTEIDDVFEFDGLDLDDTTWKAIVGYRPSDFFAVEVAYMDLGEERADFGAAEAEAKAVSAFAVGLLSLPLVDLYGKAGIARWDIEGGVHGIGIPEDPPFFRFDDSGTELAYGVGAQVKIRSWAARLEHERFDIDNADAVELYTLGLTWTF